MVTETRPFDIVEYLETDEDQAALLQDAIDEGNPVYIAYALGAVARARGGVAALAEQTGMSRQALNKALSKNGNPTLTTVINVIDALGLQMTIKPRDIAA